MNTLSKLIEQSEGYDSTKADVVTLARLVRFDPETCRLIAGDESATLAPASLSDGALLDVCAKLGPAVFGKGTSRNLPVDYLRAMSPALRAQALNEHCTNANGSKWLVRYSGEEVRAVMDGAYPGGKVGVDFENTTYLKIVNHFADTMADKLPDLRDGKSTVSRDDLNLRIIWKDINRGGAGGGYGVGVYVGNGETGARRLRVLPMIKRNACDNSLIADTQKESFSWVHRGSYAGLRVQFKDAIGVALQASAELLDRMLLAEEEEIPAFDDVLSGMAIKYGWSNDIRNAVWQGTERETTRAAIVNGITWAAHTQGLDPNAQADMEIEAGRILVADGDLFSQAAKLYRQERAGLV